MSAIDALRNRGKPADDGEEEIPEPVVEEPTTPEDEGSMSDLSPSSYESQMSASDDEVPEVIRNIRQKLGARASTTMREAVRTAREYSDDGANLLDDTILSMRQSGLSHRKIAMELGDGVTEDDIAERLSEMYVRMEKVTTAEYRMLQVGRLEQAINMCWTLASEGSTEHIELLIKAIERLNKMYELEKETAKVEVEVITNAQAVMLMSIINGVLGVITSDPRITRAIPVEELQQITARALDTAEAEIIDEDGNVPTISP